MTSSRKQEHNYKQDTNLSRSHKADVLLQQSRKYQSGRLTIFLGAAPGVGKTYAMLVRAHDLTKQGKDVVIGYVETHGRIETENLVQGLTIIPRKSIEYQANSLEEMDLDAILDKKPAIVLVDELAHTNIPSSRHEKRWQDVNELLDAGIDVFTTMNIQHLESLNDVVYQITGIRVKETVPDRVFQRIRDIRLIDLPVDELLERLNQGKVYVPEQAQHALQGFFNNANLTALRELAMQTVASHVDIDVRENFALQGLNPMALKNHILIVIDGRGYSEALVRAGCRLAENRLAAWTAVIFSKHASIDSKTDSSPQSVDIENALNLARQLGGSTEILYGEQHAKILSDYAIERGISTIVLAQPPHQPHFWFKNTFEQRLIDNILNHHPSFEISIIPISQAKKVPKYMPRGSLKKGVLLSVKETNFVLITTAISIAIASLGERFFGIEDLSVVFITAVVFVASKTRMMAAAISAILFFLAYNFFFIAPKFTFQISAHQGVITVIAFLGAALIASRLASQLREQVTALKAANSYNSTMQDLSQKLSVAANLDQIIHIALQSLAQHLKVNVWLYLPDQESAEYSSADTVLSDKQKRSAEWTYKNQQPSGRFTQTLNESDWWFLPLLASKQCLGVIGLEYKHVNNDTHKSLNIEQKRLADAMIENIAQAISRTKLTKELEVANVTSETEKLRSALLSSVSHDLRSPLASMIGAAETLSNYRHAMNEEDQNSLLEAIHLEGERLDRYIQNLLDMTRLGHDGLTLTRDWVTVDELVSSAVGRLSRYMPNSKIIVSMPEQPLNQPLSIYVHAALIEQAIFNVLENAAKFSPDGIPIALKVLQLNDQQVQIMISDQGQGISEAERDKMFDMFYTMQKGDRGQYGIGLGLTIVKAIIGAHMGQISASSAQANTGTRIEMTLPIQPVME